VRGLKQTHKSDLEVVEHTGKGFQVVKHRWKVERTMAWLLAFRRLMVRNNCYETSVLAFLHLACALACLRFLRLAEAW
jgi:transposase